MKVAAVQVRSTTDVGENIRIAEAGVREAAATGAAFVALPECADFIGTDADRFAAARSIDAHPFLNAMALLAAELRIHLLAGSVAVREAGDERLSNTSVLFAPDGARIAEYRKIHLFDADVEGSSYRESDLVEPGRRIVTADVGGIRMGMAICFDLRFPELFRALVDEGARVLLLPSAFTARTGAAHWATLIRARAIEEQCFVIAPDQVGILPPGGPAYGHSMIVDPWGTVVAEAGDEPAIITAELDLAEQDRIRATLPALANRRL